MTLSVESICRSVREYVRGTGQAKLLKFSALNDAVSKALSGVPYAQAVAAERAGKPYRLTICPAATATIAAIYGIDAYNFHAAIGLGSLRANQSKDSEVLEFWPFPERERAMAQLTELMESPVNGRHVILAAHDATAGTTTTIRELMRRKALNGTACGTPFNRQSTVVGTYLRLSHHYPARLFELATEALFAIRDPDWTEWPELPSGKARIAAARKEVLDAGFVRLLFDELSAPLRSLQSDWRVPHYFRGVERLVLDSPVKALFECGRWNNRLAMAMPQVFSKSDVVMLDPIGDSPSLRAWIVSNDPMQCVGEYDDAMATALLAVTDGNILLMRRYVQDAVNAVRIYRQVKDVVRKRIRSLVDVSDLAKANCWSISDLILGENQDR